MAASIAQQFIGVVGPALDDDELARIISTDDRLIFASASSDRGVIKAVESAFAMLHRAVQPQEVSGVAALLQAPPASLLGAVRSLTGLLRQPYPSDIDLVAGGLATDENTIHSKVTASIWVRMR